jgi:hypothetical protein
VNCGVKSSLVSNHPWSCPQSHGYIRPSPKVILRKGLIRKGSSTQTLRFRRCEGEVVGTIRPAPGSQRGLCLITERDHQGLRESFGFRIGDP